MEEQKNYDGVSSKNKIIVIIILSLLVIALGGFIIYDKVLTKKEVNDDISSEKASSSETDTNSEEQDVALNELLAKLDGYWNNQSESGLFFNLFKEDNKALLMFAYYYSEPVSIGEVIEVTELSNNIYELKVHYPGGPEDELGGPYIEKTSIYYTDLSNIESNEIKWSSQKAMQNYGVYKFAGLTIEEAQPPMDSY